MVRFSPRLTKYRRRALQLEVECVFCQCDTASTYNHHGSAIERVYFAVLPVCENVVGVEMGKYKKSFQFAIVACQTALAA